jgi:cytochrome c nitrite reductase small subunit
VTGLSIRKLAGALRKIIRKNWIPFALGLFVAVMVYVVTTVTAERFSTPEYCGATCHEMNTAYSTWEISAHHANSSGVAAECIDCHLPPEKKFFSHMTAKAVAGAKDVIKHNFGGEYDLEKMRAKVLEHMPNSRCLECHKTLLVKPSSSAARTAHQDALNSTQDSKRCVDCHDKLHERDRKIYITE